MFKKVRISERLPEMGKFVTTIDANNEHRVYQLTEYGWNMRDSDGRNSPNNNMPIVFWLEEVIDNDNLSNKRGFIRFNLDFITKNPTEDLLKAIYSNFFPIGIVNDYGYGSINEVKMFGYSQHFKEIEEFDKSPEYNMVIFDDGNGIHFEKMVQVKS